MMSNVILNIKYAEGETFNVLRKISPYAGKLAGNINPNKPRNDCKRPEIMVKTKYKIKSKK